MKHQYETVFILTPVLSDLQVKEAVKKITKFISDQEGQLVYEDNWGLRKLAYPIQHKTSGYYNLLQLECESSLIEKLETEYRRDERILRFMTIKLDKFAVAYSEKRRNLKREKENSAEAVTHSTEA